MRWTAGYSTDGCNVFFEKQEVCEKIMEDIYFRKPDIFFFFSLIAEL